ncbi:MAG: hypothetical protein ACK5O7_06245 [Holosporales bacterium]
MSLKDLAFVFLFHALWSFPAAASSWGDEFFTVEDWPFCSPQKLGEYEFDAFCQSYRVLESEGISALMAGAGEWIDRCVQANDPVTLYRTAEFLDTQRERLQTLIAKAYYNVRLLCANPPPSINGDQLSTIAASAEMRVISKWAHLFAKGEEALKNFFHLSPFFLLHLPLPDDPLLHLYQPYGWRVRPKGHGFLSPHILTFECQNLENQLCYFGRENKDLCAMIRFHLLDDPHPITLAIMRPSPLFSMQSIQHFVNAFADPSDTRDLLDLMARFRWFACRMGREDWVHFTDELAVNAQPRKNV